MLLKNIIQTERHTQNGVAPLPSRVQCGWAVLRSLLTLLSCGSSLAVLSRAKSSAPLGTVVTAGCGVLAGADFGIWVWRCRVWNGASCLVADGH